MQWRDPRFWTEQIGGSNLRAAGPKRECRRNATGVCDTACGNDGNRHGVDHLRDEREGAGLRGNVIGEEHAAVATRLAALRDDRVAATFGEPLGFARGSRRGNNFATRGFDAFQEPVLRQSKMKADHLGFEFLDDRTRVIIERGATATGNPIRVKAKLGIIGAKSGAPARLAIRIRFRHFVSEKVQIKGFSPSYSWGSRDGLASVA